MPNFLEDNVGNAAIATGLGGAGAYGLANAPALLRNKHKLVVYGGPKDYEPDLSKPTDSFSSQTRAHYHKLKELLGDKVDVVHQKARGWNSATSLIDKLRYMATHGDASGIMQVGNQGGAPGGSLASHNQVRYRAGSDFGLGSFLTSATEYDGKPSSMRIVEKPSYWDRIFVPGDQADFGESYRSRLGNVATGNIPVSSVFSNTEYSPIKGEPPISVNAANASGQQLPIQVSPGKVKSLLTVGGGSGIPIFFREGMDDPAARTYLDDILDAHRKVHGAGNFELEMLAGIKPDTKGVYGTSRSHEVTPFLNYLEERLAANDPRFKDLKLTKQLPQPELAKRFANVNNVIVSPGSTTAELMAMRGEHIPRIINALPNLNSYGFQALHFPENARVVEQKMPGSSTVMYDSPTRMEDLVKALQTKMAPVAGRTPFASAYKAPGELSMADQIIKDLDASKARRLARVKGVGAAGLGLAGAGLLYNNYFKPEPTLLEKLQRALGM